MKSDTILMVEDNEQITQANRRMLELNGYTVATARTLAEANRHIAAERPSLTVLDIMLPDGSGLDFCRDLQGAEAGIPVLFLTVLNENSDIVKGLRAGGDDYITKPYDYEVLLARIEALLRRSRLARHVPSKRDFGALTVDHTAQRVYRNGRDVLLKPREFALFRLFLENPGIYFQPETLHQRVWAVSQSADLRTLYSHISSLRKKLALDTYDTIAFEQKRGKGYRVVIRGATG